MSQPPLRLIHASDLHLELPLGGVVEAPEALREELLEAPYLAAEQVFETTLAEGADALLLAGNVVDLDLSGPRAVAFLVEQFQRLADNRIEVFWAGGAIDPPDAWPRCAPLPENVHRFPVGRVESYELRRRSQLVAHIQGVSRAAGSTPDDAKFHRDPSGLFTVGVAHGTSAAAGAEGDRVHYMALGGRHLRQTVDQSPGMAHYSGSPQGRSPQQCGVRGCTVVSVDEAGHVKTKLVATDAVRWLAETIEITAGVDESALLGQLDQRVSKLRAQHGERPLLICWRLRGSGDLINRLRPGGLADEVLQTLRKRHADAKPPTWMVELRCDEPLTVPAEWYDQETIRGDLLRQFRDLQFDERAAIDLVQFLPEGVSDQSLCDIREADRQGLLTAASKLGMDLLDVDDDE